MTKSELLDAANMLMDNKHIGKIGDGLSLISIIDEVGNGEYWSAAGDIYCLQPEKQN